MAVTITQWVLRVSALIALILGIIFWTGNTPDALVNVHMLLGILVTLSLWVLGFLFGTAKGGNWGLASVAFIWGLLVVFVGLSQQSWLVGSAHWVIQVLHLLIGLLAIGIGEMIGARYKRLTVARAQTM